MPLPPAAAPESPKQGAKSKWNGVFFSHYKIINCLYGIQSKPKFKRAITGLMLGTGFTSHDRLFCQ